MAKRRICVPIFSPAWLHYIREGWVERNIEGTWVTLSQP